MFQSRLVSTVAAIAVLFAARSAFAVNVSFSVSDDTKTVDLDNGRTATASLDANSDTLNLTPNVSATIPFLQGGSVGLVQGFTSTGNASFDVTLSITSPSATPASRDFAQTIWVTTN